MANKKFTTQSRFCQSALLHFSRPSSSYRFVPRLCLTSLTAFDEKSITHCRSFEACGITKHLFLRARAAIGASALPMALGAGLVAFLLVFLFLLGLRLGWSTPGLQATPTELVAVYNHVAPTMSTVRARASVSLATLSPLESRGRPVAWAPASHDAPVRARKRQAMIVPQWSLASSGSYRYHPDSIHVRRQFSATYSSHLFKPK